MANLTTGKGLVKSVPDSTPIPGCEVVVFRLKGSKPIFHSIVTQDNPPSLLEKFSHFGARFEAYAVDLNPNQWLEVGVHGLKSADGMGPFDLNLTIVFQPSSSRLLVECLAKDPLQLLEQQVRRSLKLAVERMSWSEILVPEADFEEDLLDAPIKDSAGRKTSSFEYLREFAGELGLNLGSIQIARKLPEATSEVARTFAEEEIRKKIIAIKAETVEVDRHLKNESDIREAQHKQALASIALLGEVRQGITDNLNKILAQIADKIESVPELRRLNEELSAIRKDIVMLPILGEAISGNSDTRKVKVINVSSGGFLSAPEVPLAKLVNRVFLLFGALDCEHKDRDLLISSILHLMAEAALADDADHALMENYGRRIQEQARKIGFAVKTREQRGLLRNLQKPEWLRAQLGE